MILKYYINRLKELNSIIKKDNDILSFIYDEIVSILKNIEDNTEIKCINSFDVNYNLRWSSKADKESGIQNIISLLDTIITDIVENYDTLVISQTKPISEDLSDDLEIVHEPDIVHNIDKNTLSHTGHPNHNISDGDNKMSLKRIFKIVSLSVFFSVLTTTTLFFIFANDYIMDNLSNRLSDPKIQDKFRGKDGKDGPTPSDVANIITRDEIFLKKIIDLMASDSENRFCGDRGDHDDINKLKEHINRIENKYAIESYIGETGGWLRTGEIQITWSYFFLTIDSTYDRKTRLELSNRLTFLLLSS